MAKKKVVKGKPVKVVAGKKAKKVSVKRTSAKRASNKNVFRARKSNWTWFLNVLFFALFGYAGYLIWSVDWVDGISLIVLLLGIILVGKIIRKR
tara:strand:- start:1893 stop:2174 length:282 start_codon:yes stop_codon:yes gene_type:complete